MDPLYGNGIDAIIGGVVQLGGQVLIAIALFPTSRFKNQEPSLAVGFLF